MKFLQAFGNFASLFQSPGRKRKRDQTDNEHVENSKSGSGQPEQAAGVSASACGNPTYSDPQRAAQVPLPVSTGLPHSETKVASLGQSTVQAETSVKHTLHSHPESRSTKRHSLQHIAAQQSVLRQSSQHPNQQISRHQVPAPIPYAQLTQALTQGNLQQLLAAKDQEIALLRQRLSQHQNTGTGESAEQSRRSLQMAQHPNINLKERAEYGKLVAMANDAEHVRTALQRPVQYTGTTASNPIAIDTPARPGARLEDEPQRNPDHSHKSGRQALGQPEIQLPPQHNQASFRTPVATKPDCRQPASSVSPSHAMQHSFNSPAFRPRRLAQHSPGLQSGMYSPHGAAAASEQSMKAAAELAEMLQQHQPYNVAAVQPQKATAEEAMDDAVARSKAFMATLSSPRAAVQQAEQQVKHASRLRQFQQAVQQPASPLPDRQKVSQQRASPHGRSLRQQQQQDGKRQDEAEPDAYGQADGDALSQSANGYSAQSEEQLSEAFSELTSREGQLEPVLQPTKAMLAAQAKAFAKGAGEKEELVDHKHSGVIITRKDIRTLTSRAWLNDEVMNVYMGLLQERDVKLRKLDGYPKCHFFNTFFINKLYKDDNKYEYKNVRRWTSKLRLDRWGQPSASVLDCDKIIIPVHLGCHWTCAVVNLREHQIHYYDSLGGRDKAVIESLARWVVDEYKDKRKQDIDTSDWPRMFADYQSRDAPFSFDQRHMEYFRVKVVADIMGTNIDIPSKHTSEDSN